MVHVFVEWTSSRYPGIWDKRGQSPNVAAELRVDDTKRSTADNEGVLQSQRRQKLR